MSFKNSNVSVTLLKFKKKKKYLSQCAYCRLSRLFCYISPFVLQPILHKVITPSSISKVLRWFSSGTKRPWEIGQIWLNQGSCMSRFDGSHAALTHENQEALSVVVVRPDLTKLWSQFHHLLLCLHSFARKFNGVLARKEFWKNM